MGLLLVTVLESVTSTSILFLMADILPLGLARQTSGSGLVTGAGNKNWNSSFYFPGFQFFPKPYCAILLVVLIKVRYKTRHLIDLVPNRLEIVLINRGRGVGGPNFILL